MGEHRGPSARGRLQRERTRAAARERRRRLLLVVLGGVAAAAVVVALVVVVLANRNGDDPAIDDYGGPLAPVSRQQDGSAAMAQPGVTAPVIDLWEDFQCPACKVLEQRLGGTLKRLAAEGRAKVVYRPFQLFQQDPLMSNSRRAANAAACMPESHWVRYHDRLFAEQPPEGRKGFQPDELVAWAADLGVTDPSFEQCVRGEQRMRTVDQASALAGRSGVDATPYLAINGRKAGADVLGSPEKLREAVEREPGGTPAPGTTRSGGNARDTFSGPPYRASRAVAAPLR